MIKDRVERFWNCVDKRGPDECWNWMRYTDRKGYGRFRWGSPSEKRSVHRIAWELSNGDDAGELCVCHRCDNPKCANPGHLFVGTHADNMADKMTKGREARGEMVKQSGLLGRDVIDIRSRYARGSRLFGYRALGREYGVSGKAIRRIVKRITWTHI